MSDGYSLGPLQRIFNDLMDIIAVIKASIVSGLAGKVNLQAATPGTAQTGHINVTGTVKATTFVGALTGNADTATDGLTSATGTAPLTLALAAKALTGSIAITPTDPGGAVALQAATPGSAQTGHANLAGTMTVEVLDIIKSQNALTRIRIDNATAGAAAYSGVECFNDQDDIAAFSLNSSSTTTYGGARSLNILHNGAYPLTFCTSNTVRMRIEGDGNTYAEQPINGEYSTNTDDGALKLNYHGYQNGTTKFRDVIFYDGKTNQVAIIDGSAVAFGIGCAPDTRFDIDAGAMEFAEMTAPANGGVNTARLFARDNGAGKTQLCVIFNTGAVIPIATEA